MGALMRVVHVAPGPPGHGVVRHALALSTLQAAAGLQTSVLRRLDPVGPADVVHLQFSDSLLTGGVTEAADAVRTWAGGLRAPLVVTLHDVPGQDPDPARDLRRLTGYEVVRTLADAVVVSSPHELPGAGPGSLLVPLPVEPLAAAGPVPAWADRPTVGVLGFVYPGKGHAQVIEAVAQHGAGTRVVVLGAASEGHADLLAELRGRARELDVDLVVTGSLSEADLHAAALAVTVPVAAYRTLGASGSVAAWHACGRRPVVTDSALVRDQLRRDPDSLLLTADLGPAVLRALRDPVSTWLTRPVDRPDVVGRHDEIYRSVLR